jgi:hypothetical protein
MVMSDARPAVTLPHEETSSDSSRTFPASGMQPVADQPQSRRERPSPDDRDRAQPRTSLDPLEEALLARCPCSSRTPDAGQRALLRTFASSAEGNDLGAVSDTELAAWGRLVPRVTVSPDVLDELELDHCAALVLAHIDGRAGLSQVLDTCGLPLTAALRTLCVLVERHIVVIRPDP